MELDEFIAKALLDIDKAISESAEKSNHRIHFTQASDNRTVEFDIAVSAESTNTRSGKAGVKVLQFAEAGGDLSKVNKNSTVSRIKFGVYIDPRTKKQEDQDYIESRQSSNDPFDVSY